LLCIKCLCHNRCGALNVCATIAVVLVVCATIAVVLVECATIAAGALNVCATIAVVCIKCLCHNRCGALLLGADESFPGPVSYKEEFARLKVKEAEMLRDVPTFILLNV